MALRKDGWSLTVYITLENKREYIKLEDHTFLKQFDDNTDGGINWKQACKINLIYPQRLRFNEWIFVYNFSCQWRKMLRNLQMLKGFSSWGSLTSRSQRRVNFSEQQGSEYNPMVINVMRFVLYAGGGGGVVSQKKLTGRLCPGVQPLTLTQKRYHFCIPHIEKWYPFHIPTLELCIPFNCCKCTVFTIWINHKTRTFSWLSHSH